MVFQAHTLRNEVDLVVGHGMGSIGGRLPCPGRELAHIGGVALHRGGHRKKLSNIRSDLIYILNTRGVAGNFTKLAKHDPSPRRRFLKPQDRGLGQMFSR